MNYAVLFPGQGSQAIGMLAGHADPEVAETFADASDILGWDMSKLVKDGPIEELSRTEKTQPALLAAGVAMLRVLMKHGAPPPTALAGHSLGEYTALVAAGCLNFADALKLVELRGQLMQAAVPAGEGGMAAIIGLDDDKVEALCQANPTGTVLEPVNYNAPGQVVVAGSRAAMDWLAANGKALGARMVMPLPVSVPSHCSLMRGAADQLFERLATIKLGTPRIPVLHNLDAQPRADAGGIRGALRDQLHRPVRWKETINELAQRGATLCVECGPGKVLTGLNKRINKDLRCIALEEPAGLQEALGLLKTV